MDSRWLVRFGLVVVSLCVALPAVAAPSAAGVDTGAAVAGGIVVVAARELWDLWKEHRKEESVKADLSALDTRMDELERFRAMLEERAANQQQESRLHAQEVRRLADATSRLTTQVAVLAAREERSG